MTDINKIAESVELFFDVPDYEKRAASEAVDCLYYVINELSSAIDYLEIMYEPFSQGGEITEESLVKRRGQISRYKDQVVENYDAVKKYIFYSVRKLNYFESDSQIVELIDSLVEGMDDVESSISEFMDILDNLESNTFKEDVIKAIDDLKKYSEELKELVKDRVIDYIDTNILANNWMKDTSDKANLDMGVKEPLSVQLHKKREEAINGVVPAMPKEQQSLNPSDAQKAYYPDFMRTMPKREFD